MMRLSGLTSPRAYRNRLRSEGAGGGGDKKASRTTGGIQGDGGRIRAPRRSSPDKNCPSALEWDVAKLPGFGRHRSRSGTLIRPAEGSPTACATDLTNLPPWPLLDMGLVIIGPLVRPDLPHIRLLSSRAWPCSPGLLQTPPHNNALALR
jgi:hypothetical protein